jgi:hypothetical protein
MCFYGQQASSLLQVTSASLFLITIAIQCAGHGDQN